MGHNYMGHNHMGHNYMGHNYMGHYYMGHDYMGHNYIGHNYIGHSYLGQCRYLALTNISVQKKTSKPISSIHCAPSVCSVILKPRRKGTEKARARIYF